MSNIYHNADALNQRLVGLAKKYGLNPIILREIILLRNQGYNNSEIANRVGISRQTVAKYLETLKTMEKEDLFNSVMITLLIIGGAALLSELFNGQRKEKEKK